MQIGQLMTSEVHWCRPDQTLQQAARLMWEEDFGCLPVCSDDGTPRTIGVITDRDICMCALLQNKPLDELRVTDAMSESVRVCSLEDEASDVEDMMKAQRIRRVPVSDAKGRLVGMVSLADLAREAERQRASASQDITESEVGDTLAAICEPHSG